MKDLAILLEAGAVMARIYDVAHNAALGDGSAQKFAEDLFVACMKTGGGMDAVLGRRL